MDVVATTLCDACHEHPGTQRWVGEGGTLAFVHGMYEMWCKGCVLRKQIEHAQWRAAAIPGLEQELEEWLYGTSMAQPLAGTPDSPADPSAQEASQK